MKKKFFLSFVVIFTTFSMYANNLRISAGSRVGDSQVRFSVAWDNSWHVAGEPSNRDAVWIFVKYKKCGVNEIWHHGLLSTTMGDHTIPASFSVEPILTAARDGSDTGIDNDYTGHNTGVMIYRSDLGKGNIPVTEITLTLVKPADATHANAGAFDTGENYEIRVLGIEMVYVPEGEFWLGEDWADIIPEAPNSFWKGSGYPPISSEDAIPQGRYQSDWYNQEALPASYPKGFRSFYCMKYEITQGQFRNFLDTSEAATGDANMPEAFSGQYRNNLASNTTPDRAQNYINWTWLKAYLDWSALRPMTELEYEKACVGPIKGRTNGWFAWGSSTLQAIWYLSGPEDGTETVMTANANCHYSTLFPSMFENTAGKYPSGSGLSWAGQYNGIGPNFTALSSPDCESTTPSYPNGTASVGVFSWYVPILRCGTTATYGFGPVGVGIFARDNTLTRETTGATYYGIMEMSGNVWEQCIGTRRGSVSDGDNAPDFTGVWGNGVLSAAGYSDVANWNTNSNSRCLRGGSWGDTDINQLKTHCRSNADYTSDAASAGIGGRGVR